MRFDFVITHPDHELFKLRVEPNNPAAFSAAKVRLSFLDMSRIKAKRASFGAFALTLEVISDAVNAAYSAAQEEIKKTEGVIGRTSGATQSFYAKKKGRLHDVIKVTQALDIVVKKAKSLLTEKCKTHKETEKDAIEVFKTVMKEHGFTLLLFP